MTMTICQDVKRHEPHAQSRRPRFNQYDILYQHLGRPTALSRLDPPPCQNCAAPSSLRTVRSDNPNNNGGRPYYKCVYCPWGAQWVTWADAKGFSPGNSPCDCGYPSRLDHFGVSKGPEKQGREFWTCATGACSYYLDGSAKPEAEAGAGVVDGMQYDRRANGNSVRVKFVQDEEE